jgi:hypothetical protein
MVSRIEELAATYRNMTRNEVCSQLEKWDNDQGRAMMSLSRPPKKYQRSPVLRTSAIRRLYWKLRLREVVHQCNYQTTFLRWQCQIQATKDTSFSLPMLGQSLTADKIRREFFSESLHSSTNEDLSRPTRTLRRGYEPVNFGRFKAKSEDCSTHNRH